MFCGLCQRLLLVVVLVVNAEQNCPPDTIRCQNGTCVPRDHPLGCIEQLHATSASKSSGGGGSLSTDEVLEDPFDQIATVADTPNASPELSNTLDVCTPTDLAFAERCARDLTDWTHMNIDQIDLIEQSVLSSSARWSVMEHGCRLSAEYHQCMGNAKTTECPLSKLTARWLDLELYFCQLLLPSVHEYQGCFTAARTAGCMVDGNDGGGGQSPFCGLITSVANDLACIHKHSASVCDTGAVEVVDPLFSETNSVREQSGCLTDDDHQSSISTNVLRVFIDIDEICSTDQSDIWKPIQKTVCAEKQLIQTHKQCFLNATKLVDCSAKPKDVGICSLVDQFSNNLDCALRVLNDICVLDAQNVVVTVQDSLNDALIANKCYLLEDNRIAESKSDDGFQLKPVHPRCNAEQENLALACLVELVEVNKKMSELQALNFLNEISDVNSSLVAGICALYQRYESCVNTSVFVHSNQMRCSFNSPLNTLARIGLSPICGSKTRTLLQKNRECISKVRQNTSNCQSGLSSLGPSIHLMLQGIHGEALLCNAYYLIRDAFDCGAKVVEALCDPDAIDDLNSLKTDVIAIGTEEGCPVDRPDDLQTIISRPVESPKARPIPSVGKSVVPAVVSTVQSQNCSPDEQKRFALCIQPITTYQPHPLAVIRQPKLIDVVCKEFVNFKTCQANVSCFPLWARGMSAMFEYACGPGQEIYLQVRQCIRKLTTRDDIRQCVTDFSRGAPQLACNSSKVLLECAIPVLSSKCGDQGVQFANNYIEQFAQAIDPSCTIQPNNNENAIVGHNCTTEQNAIIEHCGAPINELASRFGELFEGGLQQFMSNVKNLAPMFAQGCNLTTEFRQCLNQMAKSDECKVSSCLIRAGDGICNQPDTAKAIDDNLDCIFKQASDPEFGKCLRTTLSTLKTFSLGTLRKVLPEFIQCVEQIVLNRCGETPINVLRAISTTDVCLVGESFTPIPDNTVCTEALSRQHSLCVGTFHSDNRFLPVALLNDPSNIDAICDEFSAKQICSITICEQPKHRATDSLIDFLCTRRESYKAQSDCLTSVATSVEGSKCMSAYLTTNGSNECATLNNVAQCSAPLIAEKCGDQALAIAFDGMNEFIKQLDGKCTLHIPVASLKSGCSETDVVDYIQCENQIDHFFTLLSFVRNESQWSDFCQSTVRYQQCVGNMSCKLEPVSTANVLLFDKICNHMDATAREHLGCLTGFANSQIGGRCLADVATIDYLATETSKTICSSIQKLMSCASNDLLKQCGSKALWLVTETHANWARNFDANCTLSLLTNVKEIKQPVELSNEATPMTVIVDETQPIDGKIAATTLIDLVAPTIDDRIALEHPMPDFGEPLDGVQQTIEAATLDHNDERQQLAAVTRTDSQPELSHSGSTSKPEPEPEPEPQPEPQPRPSTEPEPEPTPIPTAEPGLPATAVDNEREGISTKNESNWRTKGTERPTISHWLLLVIAVIVVHFAHCCS